MKGPAFFQVEEIKNNFKKYIDEIKKNILQNHWANFNQTWHKTAFGE